MKRPLALSFSCLILSLVGSLVCSVFSLAQSGGSSEPATKEDVEAYLQAVHSHDMMLKMMNAMSKPMHQQLHEDYLKNKDRLPPDFEERMSRQMDDLLNHMPLDEITQAMVPTYQKHFSKGDIDAMRQFYSSPTGQKILNDMPAIMAESMQEMMPIMSKYMEDVKQRMQQETTRLLQQAPVHPGPNPAAAPH